MKAKDLDPKNTAALYGKNDNTSMEIRIIFDTGTKRGKKYIRDIEISIPKLHFGKPHFGKPQSQQEFVQHSIITTDFICDAADIDEVTGLVCAMEEHIADLKLERENLTGEDRRVLDETISRLNETLNQITDHQLALETHLNELDEEKLEIYLNESDGKQLEDFEYSPNINAELARATNALWEKNQQNIGIRWKTAMDKEYYNMIVREGYELEDLSNAAEQMEVPEKSKIFSRGWVTGARGKAKGRLDAIKKRLFELRSNATDAEEKKKIQDVINKVITKLGR